MSSRLARWGNSLAVRIPRDLAAAAGFAEGDQLRFEVDSGRIVVHRQDDPTLEELIAGITDENRHDELEWGPPVGREVW